MNWAMLSRLPNFLFGAPGIDADSQDWQGEGLDRRQRSLETQPLALVDDDSRFLGRLGRRGRMAVIRYKAASPLLIEARHAASLTGVPPWSAIVISAGLADMNGITAMARIKTLFPKLPVWLALPMEEPHSIIAAICAGADGYLLKQDDSEHLGACLAALSHGEPPLGRRLATHLYGLLLHPGNASLPAREHYGFSNDQVAFIRMTAERGSTADAARAMGLDEDRRGELLRSIYRQLRNRITSAAVLANMRLNHLAIH
jgi:DNA-binding NarL/FixJ family response regulator